MIKPSNLHVPMSPLAVVQNGLGREQVSSGGMLWALNQTRGNLVEERTGGENELWQCLEFFWGVGGSARKPRASCIKEESVLPLISIPGLAFCGDLEMRVKGEPIIAGEPDESVTNSALEKMASKSTAQVLSITRLTRRED